MWRRRVKIAGDNPFDAILSDIATYYDSDEWRNYADCCIYARATTEKKQRKANHQGVNLVGIQPALIGFGSNKFAVLAKRLIRNKVRIKGN